MYCKRILILTQTDKRFAARNKELCGMVKFVNNSQDVTDVTVFVTNADVAAYGEWWLLLGFGRERFARKLSTLNNETFILPRRQLDNVACLLVKREERSFEVARSYVGDNSVCDVLHRQMENLVSDASASELTDKATDYEKFVASTTNYYDAVNMDKYKFKSDARYKSVQDYSAAFERYYATGATCDYYNSVKNEISKVFMQFPPYYPLIRKYDNSFFVRVDFPSSDKYFVLGVLQSYGQIKYICYGLPAEREDFEDKDFVFVENEPIAFWMLFQDADTGQISALKEPI